MRAAGNPLVVVFLRGGMDGLSLLRPLEDPALDAARPGLVVPAGTAVPAGEGFGLHPAMATTATRMAGGSVAFVPASGLPDASRSHFTAQFEVERCDGGDPDARGGWLGRHLSATAGPTVAPFRGVSLGQPQVPMLLGGSVDVLAATSLADVALAAPGGTATLEPAVLASLWVEDDGALSGSATAGLEALARVADLDTAGPASSPGRDAMRRVNAPSAGSAQDLVTVFNSALGAEVGMLNIGGWDHHSDLGPTEGDFARMAAELDATIDTVLTGIARSTVLVVSEFGRRVAGNDSGGCDHGRGGVVMVVGTGVAGGVHGDWPGLTDLDQGDVRVANDVRAVFAEVAERTLGADPEAILPGAPSTRLGVMA